MMMQQNKNNLNLSVGIAEPKDAPAIWQILKDEIEVMRQDGRDQWQYGYPNPEVVDTDIELRQGRTLLKDGKIVGYCALVTTGEPNYDHIWDGEWLTANDTSVCHYAVVHRIAIDPKCTGQGLASAFLLMLIEEAKSCALESMRIDTNHDNAQMLHILPKLGFTRCGKVNVYDGERIAYEICF